MAEAVEISVCSQPDRHAALRLVLRDLADDQSAPLVEALARLRDEPLGPFEALVVAKQGRKLIAGAWGQPQAGRTASLWPPRGRQRQVPPPLAVAMVERVVACADQAGVALTQTLMESDDDPALVPLLRCGFQRVAELWYMEWAPGDGSPTAKVGNAEFPPHDPGQPVRLERLIQQTYANTLDCPALEGMRDVRDAIRGYRSAGRHDPSLWRIIRHRGEDVGVLLMTEYADTGQLELVYVGVAPGARGLGLGAQAVREVQSVARQRGAQRVVLAVDARNAPALSIYTAASFRRWAHRYAYVRPPGGRAQ